MVARASFRLFVSLITCIATFVAYVAVSVPRVPARAADPETDALRGLVTNLQPFVAALAGVGRFGQPLPTVSLVPAGEAGIDLATLLTDSVNGVLGSGYTGATNVNQLVSAIDGKNGTISKNRDV